MGGRGVCLCYALCAALSACEPSGTPNGPGVFIDATTGDSDATPANKCAAGACADYGACKEVPLPTGETGCEAATDADCLASNICKERGYCAVVEMPTGIHACRATKDAFCQASDKCKDPQLLNCKVWNQSCAPADLADKACTKQCQQQWPGQVCQLADGACTPSK
jgi:hypothetical protein